LLGELPAATAVRPSLLPLHREELLLIADVSQERLASLLHEALGDEEAALRVAVTAAVLVGNSGVSYVPRMSWKPSA
jgi:hypothetical protein